LFDLHFVFDVFGDVFGHFIKLRPMNPLGLIVDLYVLEEFVEVPILLAQLVDRFPVE